MKEKVKMKELPDLDTITIEDLDAGDDDSQMSVASEILQRMFEPDHFDLFMLGSTEEEELAALDKIVQELNKLSYADIDECACDYTAEESAAFNIGNSLEPNSDELKKGDTDGDSSANYFSNVPSNIDAQPFVAASDAKVTTSTDLGECKAINVPKIKEKQSTFGTTYQCTACVKEFLDEDVYNNHMAKHSNSIQSYDMFKQVSSSYRKSFACHICKITFAHKIKLICHILTHINRKLYSCSLCNYKFAYKNKYDSHMRTHTGEKPFACPICQMKFAHKPNMYAHLMTHTNIKRFTCNVCMIGFLKKSNLLNHMRTHTGERPFICDICKCGCTTKTNLVTHMRSHTGEKNFVCKICDTKFGSKVKLVHHTRTHTGEKPYTCTVCKKGFAKKINLVTHVRMHTGEKPFECTVCKGKFASKRNVVNHMRTHAVDGPLKFTVTKNNAVYDSLVIPMKSKVVEKQFSCTICERKFAKRNNLNTHFRTHTGEKPYSCGVCDSKFARQNNLKCHMRMHTGVKPYACTKCPVSFAQSKTLKEHIKKSHQPGMENKRSHTNINKKKRSRK